MRLKKIFTNYRIIFVLIVVVLALVALNPNPWVGGIAVRGVKTGSVAEEAGIENPKPGVSPRARERILAMNNEPIENLEDYYDFVSKLKENRSVVVKTNKGLYRFTTRPGYETIILNETVTKNITDFVFNETLNETINLTKEVTVNKTEEKYVGMENIGLSVYDAPRTNLRIGLDLQGGTRVLLQPEDKLDEDQMDYLLENMKKRLNVYGLADIVVREVNELPPPLGSGNQYVLVEIAGAKEDEVKELLSKQGKFEARVGNITVFKGGEDITYVCRSADCSGIDPQAGCGKAEGGYVCRFRFAISLNPGAAKRQAMATRDLEIVEQNGEEYLSEKLYLYLDNVLVDELNIGADLKGRDVTEIAISGSGSGANQQQAVFNALENMKKLQTVLITGSLPVKLEIVETSSISPVFGEQFLKNAIVIGLFAILAVTVVVFVRYRKLQVALPIFLNSVIEVIVLLGVAALIGWNLDLAAIAGIIIAVGTGVDDLVVITDETLKGKISEIYDWKARIKKAFFIIMAAYFTTVVAMIPLWYAGAGLLKGFAVTTIIGVSIGVFISRPAYAAIVEILLKEY